MNTSLYPTNNESPSYGQLFIVDSYEALDYWLQNNLNFDSDILLSLNNLFREHNVYAKSFEMMHHELQIQQAERDLNNSNLPEPELQLLFSLKPGMDRRRYNFQQCNEVAVIFQTDADGDIPKSYVTIRKKSTKELITISSMDPNVEPWIYPIFYPFGTPQGLHSNLTRENSNRRISRCAYMKYLMAIRPNEYIFVPN